MAEQYCLKWNNHQTTLVSVFTSLLDSGNLSDCILSAEGESLQAHQVVISACSPYLDKLLNANRTSNQFGVPILIFNDLKIEELRAMREYMYKGEVNIAQENLNSFLRAAQSLQIKGLAEQGGGSGDKSVDRGHGGPLAAKRRRRRTRDDCDSESSGCDSGLPNTQVIPPVQTEMKEEGPAFAEGVKAEPPDPGPGKAEPVQDLTVEDEEYDADYTHDNSHDLTNWQMDGSMNSEDFGPEQSQNASVTQPNAQDGYTGNAVADEPPDKLEMTPSIPAIVSVKHEVPDFFSSGGHSIYYSKVYQQANKAFYTDIYPSRMLPGPRPDGPMAFACTLCPFKCRTKGNLKQHTNIKHNPAAPIYSCKFCTYSTKVKGNLKCHIYTKHAEGGNLPYQ